MPFIKINTNVTINSNTLTEIKTELGSLIRSIPGKSEEWLMIDIDDKQTMFFKGMSEECAMIEVKLYGSASSETLNNFTKRITALISKLLNIQPARIYVSYYFTSNRGYNGSNF